MCELPETVQFKRAFLGTFAAVVEHGWSRLQDPMELYEVHQQDAEEMRTDLSSAIYETLETLGIAEPEEEGGSLEWLATLHEWIEDEWPAIGEYIERTTDLTEEE